MYKIIYLEIIAVLIYKMVTVVDNQIDEDEYRFDDELELIENIICDYYQWTCKLVLERFYQPDTDLGGEIQNIHTHIIQEGFQYGERGFTINDYCENAIRMVDDPEPLVSFNPDNLMDRTIEYMRNEIEAFDDVLYHTLTDNCNNPRDRRSVKQKVFQYYSCIRCRYDDGEWVGFIRDNVLMDLSEHIIIAECDE